MQIFGEKHYDESETLQCVHARMSKGDEICFRYNKIRLFNTLERQAMAVNKYASTFPMASCNKKSVITEEKNVLFLQVHN